MGKGQGLWEGRQVTQGFASVGRRCVFFSGSGSPWRVSGYREPLETVWAAQLLLQLPRSRSCPAPADGLISFVVNAV